MENPVVDFGDAHSGRAVHFAKIHYREKQNPSDLGRRAFAALMLFTINAR